jgi:hypothetical protein
MITSAGPPSRLKFMMIGEDRGSPIWVKLSTGGFIPVFSRASAQPTPSAQVPHIIHPSTRFQPRMCHLGSHRYLSSHEGVIPKKPLIFGTSMGISSLNVYWSILAQKKHITTLDNSNAHLGKIHDLQL